MMASLSVDNMRIYMRIYNLRVDNMRIYGLSGQKRWDKNKCCLMKLGLPSATERGKKCAAIKNISK